MTAYFPDVPAAAEPNETMRLVEVRHVSPSQTLDVLLGEPLTLKGDLSREATYIEQQLSNELPGLSFQGKTTSYTLGQGEQLAGAILRFNSTVAALAARAREISARVPAETEQMNLIIDGGNVAFG